MSTPRKLWLLLIFSAAYLPIHFANAQETNPSDGPASTLLFSDSFKSAPAASWYWIREHKGAWRVGDQGLEVLIEPGNMWGPQNDARNVLLRPAPLPGTNAIQIEVMLEHAPTNQYEQADLVWYFDDSNMVKVGEELVDGKLSVVMGREENDQTRTISITPLISRKVHLRMDVTVHGITGWFEVPGGERWTRVGQCELPRSPEAGATPKVGLQFYQGVAGSGHWARVTEFRMFNSQTAASVKQQK